MSWLILAIIFEAIGTTFMKLSNGFSKPVPSIAMFLFYIISLGCLTLALKYVEVGTAYAIWASIGTALIAVIGIIFFKEGISLLKIGSIALIIIGVIGLHLTINH